MTMGRRSLLMSVPGALMAWAMAQLGFGGSRDPEIYRLLAMLGDPGRAGLIGGACLAAIGDESARQIMRAVGTITSASELRTRIRDDFAKGVVFVVEGWVLSATEARLYALAALTYRE